ncbi:hypothetical protein RHGRI_025587 [Rhododendron griersonianum]|uniref:Uncharacterized protein n=1 Tax=Rhododendron griersonianum TaxID=479676 RepID=A0AAV6IU72_9ERIC|nr:hypothetical protein RHGRI_025587 [Rhododendron griersonianum]
MRVHSLRATTTSSGLSSFSAIYNGNINNNHQKYLGTVPSSISSNLEDGLFVFFVINQRGFFQGKVKQIVGSTIQDLKEGSSTPVTNFESDKSAAEYAHIYKEDGLTGGHVIMIGADPFSKSAAMEALHACLSW